MSVAFFESLRRPAAAVTAGVLLAALFAALPTATAHADAAGSSTPTSVAGTAALATSTPTITGSFAVASTLTAKPGAWTAGTAFTYQWLRNGAKISGATAATYKLTTADAGKQISVTVTGAKSGFATVAVTSAKSAKVATATTPKITGTVKVGSTLTATTGIWTAKTVFGYQWLRDGKAISGATKATYILTASDAGKKITVALTGTLTGYATVTKTSAATAAVAKGVLTAPVPKLTGTVKVGSTLTATAGTWTSGTTVKYQWFRNGTAISGATSKTYALRPTDAYATITVKTTGTKSGYTTVTKTSAATAAVAGKVYANCTLLNADYPDGIRKTGVTQDKKSGVLKPVIGNPYSSTALYNLQSIARDADRDGIMCER